MVEAKVAKRRTRNMWIHGRSRSLGTGMETMITSAFFWALVFMLLSMVELRGVTALSAEGQVLLRMKRDLKDEQGLLADWSASSVSPCTWNGVKCENNTVTHLDFSNFNVSGAVPTLMCQLPNLIHVGFYYNSLEGSFPAELLSCKRLKYLNLGGNLLSGRLPEGIDRMKTLQFLDLSENNFTGPIPEALGRLSELADLRLYSNLFNETIPTFLGQLGKLQSLRLAYNPFAPGRIPSELGNLTELTYLWLTDCNLVGNIPESLGNLTKLTNLDLAMNDLTSTIPRTIMDLRSLYQLELYQNHLQGPIPDNIGNLRIISNIDMSTNKLSGPIPESITQLRNLSSLHLYENNLSGKIPSGLADLPQLQDISIFSNSLEGNLPPSLGSMSELTVFDVSNNMLTGLLPPHLCDGGTLEILAAKQNYISGTIPEPYGKCSTIQRLLLSSNQLTGGVPEGIWGLPSLFILDLAGNRLEGGISRAIANAVNLSSIFIDNNEFSGTLPTEIGTPWNLSVIRAQHNQLSGPIPKEISLLSHLLNLHLQHNSFSGEIPVELGSCRLLNVLDLSYNQLTGAMPSSLGNLPSLNSLSLSNNRLSGEIPQSFTKLALTSFNVSDNSLSGPIPSVFLNGAFYTSFVGNQGLCGDNLLDIKACQGRKRSKLLQVVLAGTFAVAALLVLLVGLAWFYRRYSHYVRTTKGGFKSEKSSWILTSFHRLGFSEHEILDRLDDDNVIGSGGAGKVYKATLSNGEIVAVKKLWTNGRDDARHDNGFKAEVQTLGKIRHRNIVKLLCCCSNKETNLLVYEYMPNGSLGYLLHGTKAGILDWISRYKIAVGAAQGLSYLHHDCSPPIVHRDVKSNNILLDAGYEAHVSDFGVAKILESLKGDTTTVAGSYGYIAPEHAYTPKVTEKSDIYSFGVVLLELVTGKKPIAPEFGDNCDIVKWVYTKLQTPDGVMDVLDPRLSYSSKDDMLPILKVALLCTSALPVHRPTMREVLEMLVEADPQPKHRSGSKSSKSFKEPSVSKLSA